MNIKISSPRNKSGAPNTWPTPPVELMEYGESAEAHLISGRREFETMRNTCATFDIDLAVQERILEFGCANGRITRWFDTVLSEVWGVDIQADKVMWAQEHLGPPLRFMVNSPTSTLPFEAQYFTFICALSVFTHLTTTHGSCLVDLCRLLSNRGVLYITISDREAVDPDRTPGANVSLNSYLKGLNEAAPNIDDFGFVSINPYKGDLAQVYMSQQYLQRILPPWMKIIGRQPRAYADRQTAYIIQRQEVKL